jgi:hypothetical protein
VSANIAGTEWRPIFLVNVPVGLAGLIMGLRTVPETRSTTPVRVDRPGTALLAITLLSLLIPLMEGRAVGWAPWTWALLAVFPFALAAFVVVEVRAERAGRVPLLPPSVMRVPSMRRGLLLAAPFFTGFGGFMFVYALTLQDGLHLGAFGSGLALTPMALGFLAASLISSRLVTRFGAKVVPYGATIQGIGLVILAGLVLANWPHLTPLSLAPGMVVVGFGQGMTMTTLFRVILSQVPVERAGVGSGALVTTQQTFLALGVATLGTLYAALSGGSLGMRTAFVLVLGVMVLVAAVLSVFGHRLPDPRR